MTNFKGISPKVIELLARNRFEDSKPFYEEHKAELKALATDEMRRLMVDLSETLLDIDEEINVNPIYTVSRIRRDTRFSKNKMLYRENMWMMFRRPKESRYANLPAMWFEFMPACYSYGIGYFEAKPIFMEHWRKKILTEPELVRAALKAVEKAGLHPNFESYKRPKEGAPAADLQPYFNAKGVSFIKISTDMKKLNSPLIVEELKQALKTIKPMYRLLLQLHQEITENSPL